MFKSLLYPIFLIVFAFSHYTSKAQKLDSIFFNLYTDSLKKGTFNYINIDGKYSDGRYLPLTHKEVIFISNAGKFDGNSLYLDKDAKADKVVIKAVLKSDTAVWRQITIYVKKREENEKLKTIDEIFKDSNKKKNILQEKDKRSA